MLSDGQHPYTGNPWRHLQQRLRIVVNEGKAEHFLIVHDELRYIPDSDTARYLHLNLTAAPVITSEETKGLKVGKSMNSLRDGRLVRSTHHGPVTNNVFVLQGGYRRPIINYSVFVAIGLKLNDVEELQPEDLDEIVLGRPIASMRDWRMQWNSSEQLHYGDVIQGRYPHRHGGITSISLLSSALFFCIVIARCMSSKRVSHAYAAV